MFLLLTAAAVTMVFADGSQTAEEATGVSSGLSMVVISVEDLERSEAFMTMEIGCKVDGRDQLTPYETKSLWPFVDFDTTARTAVLSKGAKKTKILLVEFSGNTGKPIREASDPTSDVGLFDIAFRSKDLDESYKHLMNEGYSFLNPPFEYTASWTGNVVKEGVLIAPDGLRMATISKVKPPQDPPIEGAFGDMTDSAQIVDSINAATRFYSDVLNMSCVGDMVMAPGELDSFLNLPEGTVVRIAFYIIPGMREYPPVELLELSKDGKQLEGNSVAVKTRGMNLGMLSIGLETEDVDSLTAKVEENLYHILSEPKNVNINGLGRIRTVLVDGPSGVCVHLYQFI